MSITPDAYKKIRNLILLAAGALLAVLHADLFVSGIGYVLGILYPFLTGFCIAFVINIPMSFFERHLKALTIRDRRLSSVPARVISLVLCWVIVLAIACLVVFYFIPKLTEAIGALSDALYANTPIWYDWLLKKTEKIPAASEWLREHDFSHFNWGNAIVRILSSLKTGNSSALGSVLTLASRVIGRVTNTLIAVAFSVYLCGGKEEHKKRFRAVLYGVFPKKGADTAEQVFGITSATFRRFITGQCLECLCNGVLLTVIMTIAGMPYGFLIGLMGAVCSFIPMFGAFIAGMFGAIMVLTVSPARMAAFLVLFILFRIFDDNFMYPRVIGRSVDIPSVFVLVGITVGGALFGFGGMLFFIPLTALLYNLASFGVARGLFRRNLRITESGQVVEGALDETEDWSTFADRERKGRAPRTSSSRK